MKLFLNVFFLLLLSSLAYGIYHRSQLNFEIGERIIGFTVHFGAVIFKPLFPDYRRTGKQLKGFSSSEENL